MARPLRVEYPGALYHVVSHGNGKLWLFKHDDAYSILLDVLGEYISKYHVVIHNFVVMRNHLHLIVETKFANLGMFMNQVLRDYAIYYNRMNRRRGSVFRSRYGAFLVQKDLYYKRLTKYVFMNPVKAKLVKLPEEYWWSSLWYLVRRDRSIRWFDHKVSLSIIGGCRSLLELLTDHSVSGEVPIVYRQFYGDREWADGLIDKSRLTEEIRCHGLMERGYVTETEILQVVAKQYQVTEDELLRGDQEAAMIAMHLLDIHTSMKLVEIGRLFGLKKFTVAQRLWRFKKNQLGRKDITKIISVLQKRLFGK